MKQISMEQQKQNELDKQAGQNLSVEEKKAQRDAANKKKAEMKELQKQKNEEKKKEADAFSAVMLKASPPIQQKVYHIGQKA